MLDLAIVGGGPVGLATAIEARLAGLEVAVLERRDGVLDKACGEGLMPGAMPLLARLGIDPAGMPLLGVSYRRGGRSAQHLFSGGPGRGVRRTTLHAALIERAQSLGVRFERMRVRAIEVGQESVLVGGIRARWLVGADGLHSTVRRLAGLEGRRTGARRFGLRKHFALPPWNDRIEVHWGDDVEAYVTPVAPDLVGIAVLGRPGTNFDSALAGIPEIAERVADADQATELSGAGPMRQLTTAPCTGRVLLVGDASGYVDAITGEGLRLGFDQARAAVRSITGGPSYEGEWRRVTRDFRMLTNGLVLVANTPLRRAIVPAARALPAVYGAIVERLAR